jgi:exopolyphosphatase / guanosine-5'-triphosphate,3'-diphosphate pyrophosphatase
VQVRSKRRFVNGRNAPAREVMRRAVIDVGTNSVKLLVAEITGTAVKPLLEESTQTRLGEGFFKTHRLSREAMARTSDAIAVYIQKATSLGVESVRTIATSAARDAHNQSEFRESVRIAAGVELEIISGEREADLAFAGVNSDPKLAGRLLLSLDTGGGSSEVILGKGNLRYFRRSVPLGTVRLLEWLHASDPPGEDNLQKCLAWTRRLVDTELTADLRPLLDTLKPVQALLVGTGGTPAILVTMELGIPIFDRQLIERTTLSIDSVRARLKSLWQIPLAERRQLPGLPPDKADVIIFGALIYAVVMESLGFSEVTISTRGLRFGALIQT